MFSIRKPILSGKERERATKIIKINSRESAKWLRCKPHMEHVFKKAWRTAVSKLISLTVLLLFLLVLPLESWIAFPFCRCWLPVLDSITLANRNNQIQFKCEVHILGSFTPVTRITSFAETCRWFLLRKYALHRRTMPQKASPPLLLSALYRHRKITLELFCVRNSLSSHFLHATFPHSDSFL